MVWKIYNIESGKILKAGFETEDDASEWMEEHTDDEEQGDLEIDEMDDDEWEEYQEYLEKTEVAVEQDDEPASDVYSDDYGEDEDEELDEDEDEDEGEDEEEGYDDYGEEEEDD